MNFEVSEKFITNSKKEDILIALEDQFRKVSKCVLRQGDTLVVTSIEHRTFGSPCRSDTTTVSIHDRGDSIVIVGNVYYRPSLWFWGYLILGLFTIVMIVLPIVLYFMQKKTVQTGIQEVFTHIKIEFVTASQIQTKKLGTSDLDQLEKLGTLKEKGFITEEEFQAKKKDLLRL